MNLFKNIILYYIIFNCFSCVNSDRNFAISLSEKEIIIPKIFKLKFTEIRFELLKEYIFKNPTLENKLMVRYDFECYFGKEIYTFQIYLKPNKKITQEKLKFYTQINNIKRGNTNLGFGNVNELFLKGSGEEFLTKKGIVFIKLIAALGTEEARTILVYKFDIKNSIYETCLIQCINFLPDEYYKEYIDFNKSVIEKLKINNDNLVRFYTIIEDIINGIEILF